MFENLPPDFMPRTAEVAETALKRMKNPDIKDRGFAILGMQCGLLQAMISSGPCNGWLQTRAGLEWRAQFGEFVLNMVYVSSDNPAQVDAHKKDFLAGLRAFTQDTTGIDPGLRRP